MNPENQNTNSGPQVITPNPVNNSGVQNPQPGVSSEQTNVQPTPQDTADTSLQDLESPDTQALDSSAAGNASSGYSTTTPAAQPISAVPPQPKKQNLLTKTLVFSSIILASVFLVAVVVAFIGRNNDASNVAEIIPEQSIDVGSQSDTELFDVSVANNQNKLIVNGTLVSTNSIVVSNGAGNGFGQFSAAGLDGSYTYQLPSESGELCLDSNNCDFLTGTQLAGTIAELEAGAGITINNNIISVNKTVVTNDAGFIQGGNSFGEAAILGTNDNKSLGFETNGETKLTIGTDGSLTFPGYLEVYADGISDPLIQAGSLGVPVIGFQAYTTAITTGTDNAQAFIVQDSSFDRVFVVDTANQRITIGNSVGLVPAILTLNNTLNVSSGTCNFGCWGQSTTATLSGTAATIGNFGGQRINWGTTSGDSFTLSNGYGLWISTPTVGAGTSITNATGLLVQPISGGANNYGVRIGVASTQTLQVGYGTDSTTANAGIAFGSSRDTNLYRGAANQLSTDDGFDIAGHVAIGSGASVSTEGVVNVQDTYTGSGIGYGVAAQLELDPTAALYGGGIGLSSYVTTASGNSYDVQTLVGTLGQVSHQGTGTVSTLIGLGSFLQNNNTGAITNAYGLYVQATENTGGGSVTSNYGILVDPQTVGDSDYGVAIGEADTQTLWLQGDGGAASSGIGFGSSRDTNLYRSAADTLTTDDSFNISTKLQVGDEAGSTSQCNLQFAGYINCNAFVEIADISTETTNNTYGIRNSVQLNAGSDNSAANVASENNLVLSGTGINYTNLNVGLKGAVTVNTTGTATYAVGGTFDVSNTAAGTITAAASLLTGINNGTGTIGDGAGLWVQSATNSGTYTTNYGIRVDDQTAGTNDYGIAIEGADTYALWLGSGADNTDAANGITFGLSGDTNLYRSAADTLKTDDNLEVTQNLTVGTTLSSFYPLYVYNDGIGDDPTYVANFFHDYDDQQAYGVRIQAGADDGSGTTLYLDAYDGDGTQVGYIANTSGTFALTDISDARTKTNVADTELQGLDIINNLRVTDFNRLQNPDGPLITGFIAQEVQEVYGQAVSVGPDGLLGIQKDAFIPVLVKGVQEQQKQISEVSDRVGALESALTNLNQTQGMNSLPNKLNVTSVTASSASITTLTVRGTAAFEGDIKIAGDIKLEGKVLGNELTRGNVTVAKGKTELEYTFSDAFEAKPNIVLTATSTFAPQYRVEATKRGFTLYLAQPATEDITLNYQVQQ